MSTERASFKPARRHPLEGAARVFYMALLYCASAIHLEFIRADEHILSTRGDIRCRNVRASTEGSLLRRDNRESFDDRPARAGASTARANSDVQDDVTIANTFTVL
jgi:hypothetical protein